MKNLNRYACISTIYGCENYKATQINIFILQLQYIWPKMQKCIFASTFLKTGSMDLKICAKKKLVIGPDLHQKFHRN